MEKKFKELFTNDDLESDKDDDIQLHVQSIFNDYLRDVKNLNKSKSKNHYAYLKKPDICDELVSTTEMVHPWYLKPKKKQEEVVYKEDPETIKEIEMRKEREIYKRMLDEFYDSYYNINDRQPFDEEILENMEVNIPKTKYYYLLWNNVNKIWQMNHMMMVNIMKKMLFVNQKK